MEKEKSILTGTGTCPYCAEPVVIGYAPKTGIAIVADSCIHYSGVATLPGKCVRVTFSVAKTIPIEVS